MIYDTGYHTVRRHLRAGAPAEKPHGPHATVRPTSDSPDTDSIIEHICRIYRT